MKRNIISVVVGLVIAIVTFLIAEAINGNIHPAPAILDYKDNEAVKSFYENQPLSLWLLVLAGWIIGSFLCGFLIKFINKSNKKKTSNNCSLYFDFVSNRKLFSIATPNLVYCGWLSNFCSFNFVRT